MDFFGFFSSNLVRLLLKVTEVTTENQKLPKINKKKALKALFLLKGQKNLGPLQELDESPRSGLYLLVQIKSRYDKTTHSSSEMHEVLQEFCKQSYDRTTQACKI